MNIFLSVVRIICMIILLTLVWQNTHWSIALTLTILSIFSEVNNIVVAVLSKYVGTTYKWVILQFAEKERLANAEKNIH